MDSVNMPKHIAIIMDGNGRWAKSHNQSRVFGHRAGAKTVSKVVEYCVKSQIMALTLFAFSTENWSRPKDEISLLMSLFVKVLKDEIKALNKNQIKLKVIGNILGFPVQLQETIRAAEQLTKNNQSLRLNIAANYGGRWDIVNAVNKVLGNPEITKIDQATFANFLSLSDVPEPDLLIRTGGETRISNFLLWQVAYSEIFFTDVFWPDFGEKELDQAIKYFDSRERRFGRTSE